MPSIEARVLELLGPEGALARRLPGYEHRAGQLRFAQAAAHTLVSGGRLVGEAGTGIGKSFAYLVPALLLAEERRMPVVISTRTKALQEQLNGKDLPFLQAVLPLEFTWTVAVGRGNYLCLRRLERATRQGPGLFRDLEHSEALERIAAFAKSGASDGTRDELDFVPPAALWDEVCAEQGNCLGRECRFYVPCPWQKSRRRLHQAQLLIVNHALYFADLALRQHDVSLLPEHAAVIFDEAHHLEDIASQALGQQLSPAMFEWVLGRLLTRNARRGLLARHEAAQWAPRLSALRGDVELWFAQLSRLGAKDGNARALPEASGLVDGLSAPLLTLADDLSTWGARQLGSEDRMELATRVRRLVELAELVRAFCADVPENVVRWIERQRQQDVLRAAPVRVGPLLAEQLWQDESRAHLLVSATLGPPEDDFAWMRERLGLGPATALREPSPFPYEENVRLEIASELPDPGTEAQDFERESAELLLERILANDGRALVLATSRRYAEALRERLAAPLRAAGIELLVQGDAPLPQLIERKRDEARSVLLGLDSLWEGIDIPGPAVTLLAITRLPFAVPSHPLVAARNREIEARGGSAFAELSVPQALLRFQQGFGRLVRRHGDGGTVLVLDPRIRTRAYGRRFVAVLPTCRDADTP